MGKMIPFGSICKMSGRNSDYFRVADYVEECEGIIALTPSNIQKNQIIYDEVINLSKAAYSKNTTGTVVEGNILLCKYSKDKTSYKTALAINLPKDKIVIVNPSVILINEIQCDPKYLELVMGSRAFQKALGQIATGTMNAVKTSEIAKIQIPLPKREMQERIANTLFAYRQKHNELIQLLQQEINDRTQVIDQQIEDYIWQQNN